MYVVLLVKELMLKVFGYASFQIYREATGTASAEETGFGDPVQKAEGMAFRRACARLGLGLHLYHEDMS